MKRRNFLAAIAAAIPTISIVKAGASAKPRVVNEKCLWKFKGQPCQYAGPTLKDCQTHPINVKAYGAVGDGVTDDTKAIEAALADAAVGTYKMGDRKTVYLPSGKFLVKNTLKPTGQVCMIGSGQELTVIVSNSDAPIIHPQRDSVWRGCHIEKLTIRGNLAAGANQIGVLLDEDPYYYGVFVRDVRIEDCGGHGLRTERVFSARIENIVIRNCRGVSFYEGADMPGNLYRNITIA
jgi:polygalacturonase